MEIIVKLFIFLVNLTNVTFINRINIGSNKLWNYEIGRCGVIDPVVSYLGIWI